MHTENENKVEMIGFYGGDLLHGLSAWTSTSRDLPPEKLNRLDKMLNDLGSAGHHTPFEKSALHFLVTTDIASHIHLLKHRVGVSLNAESARYKELKDDKFYIPNDWPESEQDAYALHVRSSLDLYHATLRRLVDAGMSRKRAKESARFYLPYGTQITSDVMFNFRSFMHFQELRNNEHAQLEIKSIAAKMLKLVRETGAFGESIKAFGH